MSLLTPEIEAWVGQEIEFTSEPITASEARRFIAASGDDHPGFLTQGDGDAGQVPPMLYYGVTRPFVPAADLCEDGTVFEHRPIVGTGQTMGGSVEVEWRRPVRVGDRLRGRRRLDSLTEKSGRRRDFVIARWRTEYRDADGELVVLETYEQLLF